MTTIPLAPQLEAFRDPKLRQFALWGAAGCLAGALVGQLLLAATRSRAVANRQAVCLLIDCSGSMGIDQPGQKLREVKDAAIAFVARHSTPADRIGVIGFGQTVHRAAGINDDPAKLQSAIRELYDGGTTAMDIGIQAAANQLGELPEDWRDGGVTRSILLFTDGEPDNGPSTLAAAQQCRSSGMRIVAIGTGDAQTDFLAQVTGDRKLVFNVAAGDFDEGFRKAEKAIYGGSLVEAGGARQGFLTSFFRTAAWGLLAACGMSLALVAGQNRYLHRVALNSREATVAAIGGATAGFCGAAAGQVLYSIAAATANLPLLGALAPVTMPIGRVVGWTLMGLLAGWGLSWFVPNLAASRAALGGAIGGAVGGLAFLLALVVGDFAGALVGAAILGAAIGIMLAWVEAAFRQAWLEVYYGKEMITVSLGSQPVKVGSDNRACQVYARGARPLACQYTFADGHVTCVDFATEKSTTVEVGHEQELGGVRIVVRGSRAAGGDTPHLAPSDVSPPPAPKVLRPSAAAPPGAIAPDAKAPARTLTAPPPPPRKSPTPAVTPPPPSNASAPPPAGTRVVRPVPPPPPPRKKD